MLAGDWVGISVQIPERRFCAATGQSAYLGKCASGLSIAAELGVARDQDEGTVRVRLDAPSRQRGLDRLLVASVKAQPSAKIEMTESEVPVQLYGAARVRYGAPDVAGPMARLGEHILGLRVFTIERYRLKGRFSCLAHQWSEVLDGAVIPLHDQRAGEPEVGVREVGIEQQRLFEQAVGRLAIGRSALVYVPEAALAIIPGAHVLRPLRDNALAFGAGQRWLDRGGDTRGDVVLHREDVSQIAVVTLGPEMGPGGSIDQLAGDTHTLPGPA